jgi:phosphoserine phosphatase
MPAFQTVIFDCDSTLSTIEGIEELSVKHRVEVSRLTDLAMQGRVPLEEVYGRRLELIRPGRADLDRVAEEYVRHLVPGAARVVTGLLQGGVDVRILSGGLAPAVRHLARYLGLGPESVAAVELYFTSEGAYAGFDQSSPLARAGGKRRWVEEQGLALPRPVMLVGDGATDLEARPAVDRFVAFTGVVRREAVVAGADAVVEGPSLEGVLPLALGG